MLKPIKALALACCASLTLVSSTISSASKQHTAEFGADTELGGASLFQANELAETGYPQRTIWPGQRPSRDEDANDLELVYEEQPLAPSLPDLAPDTAKCPCRCRQRARCPCSCYPRCTCRKCPCHKNEQQLWADGKTRSAVLDSEVSWTSALEAPTHRPVTSLGNNRFGLWRRYKSLSDRPGRRSRLMISHRRKIGVPSRWYDVKPGTARPIMP